MKSHPAVPWPFRTSALLWVIWGVVHLAAGLLTLSGLATGEVAGAIHAITPRADLESLQLDYPGLWWRCSLSTGSISPGSALLPSSLLRSSGADDAGGSMWPLSSQGWPIWATSSTLTSAATRSLRVLR